MDIFIDNRYAGFSLSEEEEALIEKAAGICLAIEGEDMGWEISLSFVTDEEIHSLNRDYRGVDDATDVLSFPLAEQGFPGERLLGDIVISVDHLRAQALDFGHSTTRELLYLCVHSMFHLLGYDHMEPIDKQRMRMKEKEAMKRLGVFKNGQEDG